MDKVMTLKELNRAKEITLAGLESLLKKEVITETGQQLVHRFLDQPIIVEVRGGVAYCLDPRVKIIDHDNNDV